MKTFVNAALLLSLVATTARAQVNAGEQKPEPNLPFTMTPAEAAECASAFRPKVVYPYHYQGQDPKAFEAALAGMEIAHLSEMPLAEQGGGVAGGLHHLPERDAVLR